MALILPHLQVHTVDVHDTLRDRKTAENYLAEIEQVYEKLNKEWGVIVVGLVTDASGESRKARQLFAKKYPFLIVLDCYSHQVRVLSPAVPNNNLSQSITRLI
jgi:hypothetical protein